MRSPNYQPWMDQPVAIVRDEQTRRLRVERQRPHVIITDNSPEVRAILDRLASEGKIAVLTLPEQSREAALADIATPTLPLIVGIDPAGPGGDVGAIVTVRGDVIADIQTLPPLTPGRVIAHDPAALDPPQPEPADVVAMQEWWTMQQWALGFGVTHSRIYTQLKRESLGPSDMWRREYNAGLQRWIVSEAYERREFTDPYGKPIAKLRHDGVTMYHIDVVRDVTVRIEERMRKDAAEDATRGSRNALMFLMWIGAVPFHFNPVIPKRHALAKSWGVTLVQFDQIIRRFSAACRALNHEKEVAVPIPDGRNVRI